MFIHDSDLWLCPCESPFNGRVNYLRCAWFTLSGTSKLFYQFKSKLWWPLWFSKSRWSECRASIQNISTQTLSECLKIRPFSTLHFHRSVPLPCSLDRQSELDSDNGTCWCNTYAYTHSQRSGNRAVFVHVCVRVCSSSRVRHVLSFNTLSNRSDISHVFLWVYVSCKHGLYVVF